MPLCYGGLQQNHTWANRVRRAFKHIIIILSYESRLLTWKHATEMKIDCWVMVSRGAYVIRKYEHVWQLRDRTPYGLHNSLWERVSIVASDMVNTIPFCDVSIQHSRRDFLFFLYFLIRKLFWGDAEPIPGMHVCIPPQPELLLSEEPNVLSFSCWFSSWCGTGIRYDHVKITNVCCYRVGTWHSDQAFQDPFSLSVDDP